MNQQSEVRHCLVCRIGSLRRTSATYAKWYQSNIVLAPGLGAWLCDICGDFFFDDAEVMRLEFLLGIEDTSANQARVSDVPGGVTSPLTNGPSDQRGT